MPIQSSLTEKSKFLSFVLRHKPEAADLKLSKEGWVAIETVCQNTGITIDELNQIVKTDAKSRYTIKFDGQHNLIRANQGHSTATVQLSHVKAVPPPVLYHGTTAVDKILIEGLKPMKRHHVHLSADLDTAVSVGGRRKGAVTVFQINTVPMVDDGCVFFISENNVWLCKAVPAKYLSIYTGDAYV
jgi:putative RNA 2'-phosphotransferase